MTEAPPDEPFETTLRRLTEVVKRLEEGDLSLEESLRAFEQGVALTRAAKTRLAAAQARVDELLAVDEQGRAITRPVE